jgi:hypothetical protein
MAIQYLENSATISTTEYSLPNNSTTLTPQTTAGQVQCFIDFNAMTASEEYRIRIYEQARTADTQRLVWDARLVGAQSQPLFATPALTLSRGWDITVTKVAGTDRTITWSVRRWPDA